MKFDDLLSQNVMNRRRFLKKAGSVGVLSAFPTMLFGVVKEKTALIVPQQKISLNLYHIHTGEKFLQTFSACEMNDAVLRKEFSHLMRDWRTGETVQMDQKLFELTAYLGRQTASKKPFHIVCGYRSPQTNKMLKQKNRGVASKSYHMKGQAVDLYLPHFPLNKLRDTAKKVEAGGVGYYPSAGFIHMDVRGHPAYW